MYMNRKGVQFGSRDCYDLRIVLGKINANAIRTFKETIEKRDKEGLMYGLPCDVCEFDDNYGVKDWQAAKQKWFDILDAIIYALEDKEPCSSDYYDTQMICGEPDSRGLIPVTIVRSDEEAHEKYAEDYKIHREKVLEGRKLFAEHFDSLWW